MRSRHFDTFLRDLKELDIAICIGNAPNVLAAAATSVEIGVDELEIANALEPLPVVRAKTVDLLVPAEAEFVLEGRVYLDRLHDEGPFVDLTGTYDVVRQEPVFELHAITHRRDAIWQALLPGALEHKLLMGMPREPTIFRKVNEVTRCLDVNISPGGCSWLHAIVQIDKQGEDDGLRAIQAAFAGHRSCKHVFVVDPDIDIYDPLAVEWALATRFQAGRQMVVLDKEPGSSLDPSAEPGTHLTSKVGFDLTKPLQAAGKDFDRAAFSTSGSEPLPVWIKGILFWSLLKKNKTSWTARRVVPPPSRCKSWLRWAPSMGLSACCRSARCRLPESATTTWVRPGWLSWMRWQPAAVERRCWRRSTRPAWTLKTGNRWA